MSSKKICGTLQGGTAVSWKKLEYCHKVAILAYRRFLFQIQALRCKHKKLHVKHSNHKNDFKKRTMYKVKNNDLGAILQ